MARNRPIGAKVSSIARVAQRVPPMQFRYKTYAAARNLVPGAVIRIDQGDEEVVGLFRDRITSIAWCWRTLPRFANGVNGRQIWRFYPNSVDPVTHVLSPELELTRTDYVREVAFDPRGVIHWSETTDSHQLRIWERPLDDPHQEMNLSAETIGGYWAGNFAYSPRPGLYFSNGNIQGAGIWRFSGGVSEWPRIYSSAGPIMGFCFEDDDTILYTDGSATIWRLTISSQSVAPAFTSKLGREFCDVETVPDRSQLAEGDPRRQ